MRTIIAGSRSVTDPAELERAIAASGLRITQVISGGARGADALGEAWAWRNGVPLSLMPAEWDRLGKRAGLIRNEEMAEAADACIALWDGQSPGTRHMIQTAGNAGLITITHMVKPMNLAPPPLPMTLCPPPPPPFWALPAGSQLVAGMGRATVLPDMDFETYSEAGFIWDAATNKWECPEGATKKGLPIVGAARYAEHPSTEVLSFYYDLKDGIGRRCWLPGMPNPTPLFEHVHQFPVEAWNSGFEYWIWNKVCAPKYGWPALEVRALRCAMAKSRAHSLPGALDGAGKVLALQYQKDADGTRLLKKFSVPRNPTAKDKRTRIRLHEDPVDGPKLIAYNADDILAEAEASSRIPDLEGEELEFWLLDQEINRRGVQMDVAGISNCIAIVKQAHEQYNAELYALTGGTVAKASELQKLIGWLGAHGVRMTSLDEENIDAALAADDKARKEEMAMLTSPSFLLPPGHVPPMPPACRRALEIRQLVGSAAVKKVFAMANQVTAAGVLHDLFTYYGARTGRTTGNGPQPTNLPNSGPEVIECGACGEFHSVAHTAACPWCRVPYPPGGRKPVEWNPRAVECALRVIATRDLRTVEYYLGDAMAAVSGCLRGLFIARDGHDLICSDYSSIEAVVLAMIAGEQWRIDVFRTHGKIYEMSAAKITGIPFEDFMRHAGYSDAELAAPDWYLRKPAAKGSHHPQRKKIGKVAELASGYQGWVGSWVAFGADEFMSEPEMKSGILAWREASPAIVEFWGGQERGRWRNAVPELYGVEGMFVAAVMNPGREYEFRGFRFIMRGDCVYLRLLSGRYLAYHRPRLQPNPERGGLSISYEGNNTNPKNGPVGWVRMPTWGGRLTENIVQATARDIQWFGMLNLRRAGYPVVLHVYDEDIAEVPHGYGSVQELESIMSTMPAWAHDWPIKAQGGWRGRRYRKD